MALGRGQPALRRFDVRGRPLTGKVCRDSLTPLGDLQLGQGKRILESFDVGIVLIENLAAHDLERSRHVIPLVLDPPQQIVVLHRLGDPPFGERGIACQLDLEPQLIQLRVEIRQQRRMVEDVVIGLQQLLIEVERAPRQVRRVRHAELLSQRIDFVLITDNFGGLLREQLLQLGLLLRPSRGPVRCAAGRGIGLLRYGLLRLRALV